MWKSIKQGFWTGVQRSNQRFRDEHGHEPTLEDSVRAGIDRGRQNARRGLGPFGGELNNEDKQTDDGKGQK